jgi:transcriptional regulator with XRE-family HTH domain
MLGSIFPTANNGKMPRKEPQDRNEETVGQRLARLRRDRGLTQVELAERVGLAQPNVSDYERDVLRLHTELILHLAVVLKVSSDELLGRQPARARPIMNRRLLRRIKQTEDLSTRCQQAILRTINAFLSKP